MKEFKTLGPTQFGVGDGAKTRFSVARPGDIVRDSSIESVRRVGWQGDQLLYPYPRTNLAIASNDFTNSAWKGSPSLYIDFLAGIMPSQVSFSRATTATYSGRDRLIHTAAINEPRFVYDPANGQSEGLLVEGQATNLFNWSEDFENSYWTKSNVVVQPNAAVSPYGTQTATKLIADTETSTHYLTRFVTPPGGSAAFSLFAKAGELSAFQLHSYQGSVPSNPIVVYVNLDTGTVTQTGGSTIAFGIEQFPDGWWRVFGSGPVVNTSVSWSIRLRDSAGNVTFAGDGISGVYIWGAQLEEGSRPTSYIPTEGSQVTRAADDAVIPVGDWFNPDEGTLIIKAELTSLQTNNFGRIFALTDATQDNRIFVMSNDSGGISLQTTVDGVNATSPYTTLSDPKLSVAVSWGSGATRWTLNGNVRQVVNQSPVITDMPTLTLLASRSLSNRNNGTVERITYYPRALSDAELEALTS